VKTTLSSAAAGIELQAVDGVLTMIVSRVIKGEGDRPDRLAVITQSLTTEEAARFADCFVGMACIAELQAFERDTDRAFEVMGLTVAAAP
jgi:hypothetical protein